LHPLQLQAPRGEPSFYVMAPLLRRGGFDPLHPLQFQALRCEPSLYVMALLASGKERHRP
ncbi:MAG: hypothetical protein ACOY99_10295, partial [Pseudomonadota bacterium]